MNSRTSVMSRRTTTKTRLQRFNLNSTVFLNLLWKNKETCRRNTTVSETNSWKPTLLLLKLTLTRKRSKRKKWSRSRKSSSKILKEQKSRLNNWLKISRFKQKQPTNMRRKSESSATRTMITLKRITSSFTRLKSSQKQPARLMTSKTSSKNWAQRTKKSQANSTWSTSSTRMNRRSAKSSKMSSKTLRAKCAPTCGSDPSQRTKSRKKATNRQSKFMTTSLLLWPAAESKPITNSMPSTDLSQLRSNFSKTQKKWSKAQ